MAENSGPAKLHFGQQGSGRYGEREKVTTREEVRLYRTNTAAGACHWSGDEIGLFHHGRVALKEPAERRNTVTSMSHPAITVKGQNPLLALHIPREGISGSIGSGPAGGG